MPVFLTIKQILAMCWRERLVALKFGAIPLAINLILVVAFAEAALARAGLPANRLDRSELARYAAARCADGVVNAARRVAADARAARHRSAGVALGEPASGDHPAPAQSPRLRS